MSDQLQAEPFAGIPNGNRRLAAHFTCVYQHQNNHPITKLPTYPILHVVHRAGVVSSLSMRFMTWNSLGMGVDKQALLRIYKASNSIDFIFLQEGDAGFDNAKTESNSCPTMMFFDRSSSALEVVAALSSSEIGIGPASGVSRAAYYNIVATAAAYADVAEAACTHYLAKQTIKDWILTPAQAGKRINGKAVRVHRGRVDGAGDKNFKAELVRQILDPVQKRLNLLGHRRPKAIDLTARTLRIYYWHAPLGRDTTLAEVGFGPTYSGLAGDGCGGELAVAANILFAKHLGATGAFPDDTILVGDLNINNKAAKAIYSTTNVITSQDGWCHAIANANLPLTSEVTQLVEGDLGQSDHSPIVFTIV
jgi:hypothetical protein